MESGRRLEPSQDLVSATSDHWRPRPEEKQEECNKDCQHTRANQHGLPMKFCLSKRRDLSSNPGQQDREDQKQANHDPLDLPLNIEQAHPKTHETDQQ